MSAKSTGALLLGTEADADNLARSTFRDGAAPDYPGIRDKLVKFSKLLPDGAKAPEGLVTALQEYKQAAARGTTHPGQRRIRQTKFLEIMEKL